MRLMQVSWVVKAVGGGPLQARYRTTDGKSETWYNDGNGIPELVSADLGSMWHQEQRGVSNTRTLPSGMTTMQSIAVPSAGVYLVVSSRAFAKDSSSHTFSSIGLRP